MKEPWGMHGRDLTPLLRNPDGPWPHPAMLVSTGRKFGSDTNATPPGEQEAMDGVPWYVMIRDKRYKYVRPLVTDYDELYDLEQDPEELDNLAVKAAHQDLLRRMRTAMIAELRRTEAGFVDRMPPVKEARA
jgi:arylsulfatase A-like enzyme